MPRRRERRGRPTLVGRQARRVPTIVWTGLLLSACVGLLGEVSLLLGWRRLDPTSLPTPRDFNVVDVSISDLQQALASRRITSRALVLRYLERLGLYGRLVNPAITVNRRALELADQLDRERAEGRFRGSLHGIPIAVKDNIQTIDMATTGGALAFRDFVPPYEATLVTRLEAAGAIILAKTVMTELAAQVAHSMPADYSAVGGYSYNPYDPRPDPRAGRDRYRLPFADGRAALTTGGSSSGIGVAASLWAAAVGTETSGSILAPASFTMLVGLKPTVGRISRWGVMPFTRDQDTAGPLARTVTDAAILLGVMEGEDAHDPATTRCASPPGHDYRPFLKPDGLRGARIGIPRATFTESVLVPGTSTRFGGLNAAEQEPFKQAIQVLEEHGAVIVDPADIPSLVDTEPAHNFLRFPGCTAATALNCSIDWLYGRKRDFNAWLATLGPTAPVRSLAELRAFNITNAKRGALQYGQDLLDAADSVDLDRDATRYETDHAKVGDLVRTYGIDEVITAHHLYALVFWAHSGSVLAATAGYPSVIVPFGLVPNRPSPPFPSGFDAGPSPAGVTFTSTACQEPRLLAIAYAFEQATRKRVPPSSTPSIGHRSEVEAISQAR